MHISLILTGGTICSRTDPDGLRRSDADRAGTILEARFRQAHPDSDAVFQVHSPVNCLSEDLTPPDLTALLNCLAGLDLRDTDGIIIAHGTDTLDQTAAFLSAALPEIAVPVLLVSAIAPPEHPASNADANFAAAVSLIAKGLAPAVWAVYQNTDGVVYLHAGAELERCNHGSADFFSPHMLPAKNAPLAPKRPVKPLDRVQRDAEILLLHPYNGLRYDRIPLDGVSAVVHGTYHSCTANSAADSPYSVLTLLRRCAEYGIPCFLAPCNPETAQYGSTAILLHAGAIPLDLPLTFAHMAVRLGVLRGLSGDALTGFIRSAYESAKA